jgi:hypothetical protein
VTNSGAGRPDLFTMRGAGAGTFWSLPRRDEKAWSA